MPTYLRACSVGYAEAGDDEHLVGLTWQVLDHIKDPYLPSWSRSLLAVEDSQSEKDAEV